MDIIVKAKINGGTHPKYGKIVKGQEYKINENDFGNELFHKPKSPANWIPPWERKVEETPVESTNDKE